MTDDQLTLGVAAALVLALAALVIGLYAARVAQKARDDLEAWKQREVYRERRKANVGPPEGIGERRRHAHPDPTVRARRRDADAPRYEQRPAELDDVRDELGDDYDEQPRAGAHRHPDEPATTEAPAVDPRTQQIGVQTPPSWPRATPHLPRPGTIRRDQ